MDKKKSILNISVSIIFKVVTMIFAIIVRRFLIRICGNEVNGLNALYLSLIGFLAVAELGVGSAIAFCMYKPIVEGNKNQVAALYHLFRRLYLIIAGIILLAGLLLMPFLHYFAKDYAELDVNLYSTFILMLLSVLITYLFSAKTSLISAYKNNYITTIIMSGGLVLQYVLQVLVLKQTGSFDAYLACRIVAALFQWGITEMVTRKKYSDILANPQKIDGETQSILVKSIKAMFMHKVGELLVSTVDSITISVFIGVVALGEYSNYTMILTSMTGILNLVFVSLTSVLGHLYAKEGKQRSRRVYESLHLVNFCIGMIFYLGFYAVADDLVGLLFAENLMSERSIVIAIATNGFVQYMRKASQVFRDATGTFYHDRWKPLIEGSLNLILSVVLVNFIGVAGVVVATMITSLLICHIVEPYVLYKYAFQQSPTKQYLRTMCFFAVFFLGLVLVEACVSKGSNLFANIITAGFTSVGISAGLCIVVMACLKRETATLWRFVWRKVKDNE